jgi:chromosomal replication initiation ATPase DnaA
VSDLEAALAAHLNGKFFWEHTETLDEASTPTEVAEIRRLQRKFAKGAKHVTSRNKALNDLVVSKSSGCTLKGDLAMLEPLVNAICEAYGVSSSDVVGRGKKWNVAKARKHFYWAIFRYHPSLSLLKAGRMLGKNHTTVLHGKLSFEKDYDIEMVGVVDELMGWK